MCTEANSSEEKGPAWRAAEAAGIDMSLVSLNLAKSVEQGLKDHDAALSLVLSQREAVRRANGEPDHPLPSIAVTGPTSKTAGSRGGAQFWVENIGPVGFVVCEMSVKKALLRDVIGSRGEKKLELCLTNYETYESPLFRPGFLGDKWPVVDFYVEVLGAKRQVFFFAQAKTTTRSLDTHIRVSSKKSDIAGLLKIPGPTYLFAIHEPTGRVFVQCVHSQTPVKAITKISVANELTTARLKDLQGEVNQFWASNTFKPTHSVFA